MDSNPGENVNPPAPTGILLADVLPFIAPEHEFVINLALARRTVALQEGQIKQYREELKNCADKISELEAQIDPGEKQD